MIRQHTQAPSQQEISRLIDEFVRSEPGAESSSLALLSLLRRLAPAQAGAICHLSTDQQPTIVAISPSQDAESAAWLDAALKLAPQAAEQGVATAPFSTGDDLYGQPCASHIVCINLGETKDHQRAIALFLISAANQEELADRTNRLMLTPLVTQAVAAQDALRRHQAGARRLELATQLAAASARHTRLSAAAMALCDAASTLLRCDRVCLGFARSRVVAMIAMSHTERFNRKMRLIQRLEAVMEECFDQDAEIIWPPPADDTRATRDMQRFSQQFGPLAMVAVPLRYAGEPVGVLTLERPEAEPFTTEEIESLRMACDLSAARLVDLRMNDRWIGAKAAHDIRRAASTLLGPQRVWIKLTAILIAISLAMLIFVKGPYRAEAPFVFEAAQQRMIPAPFDGYLASVSVDIGDHVEPRQTVLATLDTSDLLLQLAALQAQRQRSVKEASIARRDKRIAESQIARAAADEAQAQIQLLTHRIEQASITSPIAGMVVQGDLRQRLGAPVKTGDLLFEIAPLDTLRARLAVSEELIVDVHEGQRGSLASAAYPNVRTPFIVERISPVASVVQGRNVFDVRVQLVNKTPWMRPGMEGVGRIDIDRRPYGAIWTRRLVNWIRMRLWL